MRPPAIGPVDALSVGLALVATSASFLLVSPLFGFSVALGAALEMVNFRNLRRTCERVVTGEATSGLVMSGFSFRFVLLGGVVGVALYAGAHPVGLLVGLSLIVPAMLAAAWHTRPVALPASEGPAAPDEEWDRWNPWLARESDDDEDWA
jgi:hypothetical protein